MDALQGRIQYLLGQYANGVASQPEENELFTIMAEGRNDDLVKGVMRQMMQAEVPADMDKEKWGPVLRKILDDEKEISAGQAVVVPHKRTIKILNWRRVAAAASIIVLIGAGIVYYKGHQKVGQPGSSNQLASVPEADIAPPSAANAVLTLSNGQVIMLDSAGKGTLARQGAVDIVKLSDGQIRYSSGTPEQAKGAVLYNTLTNPAGSKVVNITLEDGTKVWLNSKSSLRYPTAFTGELRQVEITGEAYFEVAQMSSPASKGQESRIPFQVKANEVSIQVLGTHFNINSYAEEKTIRTTLLEGSVRVSKDGQSVLLKPGQQAQVASLNESRTNRTSIKVDRPDVDEVMAWKNGRFSFQNADLETIMRQIARWYNVEVVYENKINDRYTVDVSRDVPVSQLFKFIEMSGGVVFTIDDKKVVVRK